MKTEEILKAEIDLLRATLNGVLCLAEIEATAGGSKTWGKAAEEIKIVLAETKPEGTK